MTLVLDRCQGICTAEYLSRDSTKRILFDRDLNPDPIEFNVTRSGYFTGYDTTQCPIICELDTDEEHISVIPNDTIKVMPEAISKTYTFTCYADIGVLGRASGYGEIIV